MQLFHPYMFIPTSTVIREMRVLRLKTTIKDWIPHFEPCQKHLVYRRARQNLINITHYCRSWLNQIWHRLFPNCVESCNSLEGKNRVKKNWLNTFKITINIYISQFHLFGGNMNLVYICTLGLMYMLRLVYVID